MNLIVNVIGATNALFISDCRVDYFRAGWPLRGPGIGECSRVVCPGQYRGWPRSGELQF
jgi:hypothetical protein